MASGNGSGVRVLSRRLVKASDESIQPHVLPVSNINLIVPFQISMLCIYPRRRKYVGNVVTFTAVEASVEEINRKPLQEVASMVRDAIALPAPASSYDERIQESTGWRSTMGRDKKRYMDTVSVGLGSPAVSVTAFLSFAVDTEIGFGHAVMALPMSSFSARVCSAFVQLVARPGGDGSWITSAFVWPRLAAALEAGEIFKPVTTEYLGLWPASAVNYAGMITSKI
uniref:Uncharacterized protein n=1 Tax=Leersia perrieri TaxID=77586 RepID=A0A0D9WDB9_9ORYZ